MELHEIPFKRRFSVNLYRNLELKMGEMSLYKDWVHTDRGDPYPVLERIGCPEESIARNRYTVQAGQGGSVRRLLGSYFPWNSYELRLTDFCNASAGLVLESAVGRFSVIFDSAGNVCVQDGEGMRQFPGSRPAKGWTVAFHGTAVSIYRQCDAADELVADVGSDLLSALRREELFRSATVSLWIAVQPGGLCRLHMVRWFLSVGISQADLKPIRYEDGTPMLQNGRLYLTVSSRCESGCFQSVLSWAPTACDFRLEGALFFDSGDGLWCPDVASSILYDRNSRKWLLWVCSFSHGHVLGHAELQADPRFGIQVVDIRLMKSQAQAGSTAFYAVENDEDPDLILVNGIWHLAICRVGTDGKYHYHHFISESGPFDGFRFVDQTPGGEKTGGMFVRFGDRVCFVCGSDFKRRAVYDVYPLSDFTHCEHLQCNYDDGGFRGWGTVMELPCGTRRCWVWLTFDRHNGSAWNWSYGNLYVYDSGTFPLLT